MSARLSQLRGGDGHRRPRPAEGGQHAGLPGRSRWLDLGGPVRYIDYGGRARDPLIVCVHGLGGSAVNWAAIAPLLTDRYRVIAPDLAGHGLTRSAGRGTDVAANRKLLHAFLGAVSAEPVILAGNSMGGMIALLEASAAPERVSRLVLVDPALPFVPARPDLLVATVFALGAIPLVGRAILGRTRSLQPETVVAGALTLCCADPALVPADVVALHVALAGQRSDIPDAGRDMSAATRSVIATAASPEYRERIKAVSCPVLLLHGDRDRLVPVSAARAAVRAHPSWSLSVLAGVGHVPQLESPQQSAFVIREWLHETDRHPSWRPGRAAHRRRGLKAEGPADQDLRPWSGGTNGRTVKMYPLFRVRRKAPQER